MGVNHFADMTVEEFRKYMGKKQSPERDEPIEYEDIDVNASPIDWRTKGAVTAVKD